VHEQLLRALLFDVCGTLDGNKAIGFDERYSEKIVSIVNDKSLFRYSVTLSLWTEEFDKHHSEKNNVKPYNSIYHLFRQAYEEAMPVMEPIILVAPSSMH
jgi:hypothetical protein